MAFPDLPFPIPGEPSSWLALATAFYSVWTTAFKRADLRLYVAPAVRYASPYQNSVFEMFEIPVTILNQGARTGTVMAMHLSVRRLGEAADGVGNKSSGADTKRFFSGGTGAWSLDQARGAAAAPFVPVALAGRTSQSVIVQFYPRDGETIRQVIEAAGSYELTVRVETALSRDNGVLARWFSAVFGRRLKPLTIVMRLPHLDHRAFTSGSGTVSLYQRDYRATGG